MKYRKIPVVVEAEVYSAGLEDGFARCYSYSCSNPFDLQCKTCYKHRPYINTLEGKLYITKGDFIITGVEQERYPCKPEIFRKTYEEVDEDDVIGRDAIGGMHGGGVGYNPQGLFCGECCRVSCEGCPIADDQ